jgi:hypothetical protein
MAQLSRRDGGEGRAARRPTYEVDSLATRTHPAQQKRRAIRPGIMGESRAFHGKIAAGHVGFRLIELAAENDAARDCFWV